jgi:hypothetical protein
MIKGEAHQKHVPHTKVEKPCCHMPQGGAPFLFCFFLISSGLECFNFSCIFDVFLSFYLVKSNV